VWDQLLLPEIDRQQKQGRGCRKPVVWYKCFLYQGATWKMAQRVVANVEFHFGKLFPRVGFMVTNLLLSRTVVRFYNKRGTAGHGSRKTQALEQRLVKTGGRLIKRTRYYGLLLAAAWGHVARDCGAPITRIRKP
jgi:hypothetical protein